MLKMVFYIHLLLYLLSTVNASKLLEATSFVLGHTVTTYEDFPTRNTQRLLKSATSEDFAFYYYINLSFTSNRSSIVKISRAVPVILITVFL